MHITEHVPLSTLTTFRTGGPARFLISCDTAEEIPQAVVFAREKKVPLIPLGGGSNMLVPDEGVVAAFVRLLTSKITTRNEGDSVMYTAEAGAWWDDVVARAVADNAWGIENLSAIPGTVGAAAVQNIGAYGSALSDTLVSVTAFDTRENLVKEFSKAACRFGYRTSLFKEERDRYVITAITLQLSKIPNPNFSYRDLTERFLGRTPTLSDIREAVVEIRAGKFPPLEQYGTAGSFFLNPVVSADEAHELAARFPAMPFFELPEGGVKVPIGWIFDRVLSLKGMRVGNAFVWEKQALVIATESNACTADVRALAEKIKTETKEKTGIVIVPEVRIF